jgi:hypothetical protein
MENYKNKIYYILIISFTLLFQNCELFGDDNDTPQLPEATQTGKGTFACLINGEPYVITNTNQQVAIYQQGQLQFGGGGITMIFGNPLEINTNYILIGKSRYFVDPNPQLGCHYDFDNSYAGSVTFTKIDRTNYIISGTFEFSTQKGGCEDIKITQGLFDLKYIP